ncbi:uncharacterized protein LOC113502139 isoform X2 [Trichoplusia ni]|uniref:Uncharacterized protein LOC113502139 isoform X2 n=1 Tax=Trichoplusia ni TaxID=7111 RepID=A0A7E5WF66_TRINI|nr:uncharacterized protein LOC113502139 isoform X2 [Trichoplusia ni]
MEPNFPRTDAQLNRSLYALMINATEVIDDVANGMYADRCQWQTAMFGHRFSVSRTSCPGQDNGSIVNVLRNWLRTHEEAQVMLASVLVVVGLWWLVRAVLTLLINLVCPLLVVILAVVCVPQLRAPLLGQNYPVLANLLRTILLKMAENIKT